MIKSDQLDNFQTFLYGLNSSVNKTEKHFSLAQKISDNIGSASSSWKLQGLDFQLVSGRDKLAAYIQDGTTIHQGVLNGFIIYFFYNIQKDFSENVQERANQLKRLESFFSFIDSAKTKDTEPDQTKKLIDYLLKKIELPTLESEIDLKWNLQFLKNDDGKWSPLFLKNNRQSFDFPNAEHPKESDSKTPTESVSNKGKWVLIGLIAVAILTASYFGYNYLDQQRQLKEQTLEEERILSNATMLHNGYSNQLNQLYASIEVELKSQEKIISKTTTDKIISLSDNLKPYRYLHNQKLLEQPLSRERAELFRYLMQLDLLEETYRTIFDKANFSYGDFSNMNLSNIDLTAFIQGVDGDYGNNGQLLITTHSRPNLKHSYFNTCNLTNAKLYGDFSHSNFSGATLDKTIFNWSKVQHSDFSKTKLRMRVNNSDFRNSNFENTVNYSVFEGSDFRGVSFNNSHLHTYNNGGSSFYNPNLEDHLIPKIGNNIIFKNVFLGSDQVWTEFRFDNNIYHDYKNSSENVDYIGRTFFSQYHKNTDDSWTYDLIVPIDFLLTETKKEVILLDDNFKTIGNSFSKNEFVDFWSDTSNVLTHYIVQSNDLYFTADLEVKNEERIFNGDNISTKRDTTFIQSGSDFYCYRYAKKSKWVCPKLFPVSKNQPPASFEKCTFYGAVFISKIKNVSFKGSQFRRTVFQNSQLYNIDFTDTSGDFYFDPDTVIDSILINNNSFMGNLEKEERILENKSFKIGNSPEFTTKEYIENEDLNKRMGGLLIRDATVKLKSIIQMKKRLYFTKSDDEDSYIIIKDSLYLQRLGAIK